MQPLTSQRGGHCLLHIEITFPYQLYVEIKCWMFVCCRKVVAVNQVCSLSCSNLFFINLSFEHTNDGALTTGSKAQGVGFMLRCSISVRFQRANERGNSCIDFSKEPYNKNLTSTHIFILSNWTKLCARLSTQILVVKGQSCSCELITRQDKLRKG